MIQEDLETWEQLEDRLRQLKGERANLVSEHAPARVSSLLFRGHQDQNWSLETTLDRVAPQPWSFTQYYRVAYRAKAQVETFTGSRWDVPDYPEIEAWWSDYDNIWRNVPAYDYLIYIRHHGFPSPLLDWTRSPYVAAYFAFAQPSAERVAIYAYMETPRGSKGGWATDPLIRGLGPYVRSHSRHFLQQSEYTFAAQFIEGRWMFAPHEAVFATAGERQDRLWKFTLPSGERSKVLRNLEAYNLNAFSLFQTEEALLRTISVREIELPDE